MGIPHQAFNCKLIIFCVSFIFFHVAFSQSVRADNSLFIVKDVVVDVTAENSVAAQEQAYVKAQSRAFRILAKRLVQEAQVQQVKTPDFETVASLVKDYETTNERVSAVRYVGTYTFRFREDAVSRYFSISGVSYTNQVSTTLLVLPVFQKDGKNTIWSERNIWMQAWHRNEVSSGLVPVEVPIGDLMDIADIDDDQALRYERRSLDRMLKRYDAEEAAIMISVPDVNLASVKTDAERAIGNLRISIYRTDRIKAEHVKDIIIEAGANETRAALYDRASTLAYGALQKDWKNKTLSSAAQNQKFRVRATYANARQWVQIQRSLKTVVGLSDLQIMSVKPIEAHLSFTFRGDEARLRDAMKHTNMSLGQSFPDSSQKFRINSDAPSVIYDLIVGKNKKAGNFYNGIKPAAGQGDTTSSHTF
ncbi:MAG: DUF2066 domain-containing protein [Alphaproteobacteria bacterium]